MKYLDLSRQYAGVNDAYWRKRKSFEHEREVRALHEDFSHREVGKLIDCDVEVLIEAVYVSPQAPGWFTRLLNEVNRKFDVGVEV